MLFFKKKESLLEHFGAILLVSTAAVLFWRGVWGLTDLVLFPEDPAMSYAVSMFFGLVLFYVQEKKLK